MTFSLDELNVTPDWLKAPAKSYDRHPGDTGKRSFGDGPRDRQGPPRGERKGPPRRDRPPGGRRDDRSGGRPAGRPPAPRQEAPPQPLPNVDVQFVPNEAVLTALIETVRQSGRAFALFDLAKLVLNKPERHNVKFAHKDGSLYCALLTGGVFVAQEEAIRHTLRQGVDKVFTRQDKPIDPPKGNFQFVNRCGLTGEWLGPPNYHEYQARLVRHHQQRLAHMPFERFKSSVETVHDPEAVKAWVESKSKITEYTCLLDTEPKVFTDRGELEKHVRQTHLDKIVTAVPHVELTGVMSRQLEDRRLLELVRNAWEGECRFPIRTVNELRPHLVKAGLHFFKHKKGVTYITPIKLNRFDSITHLTEHVQKIVTYLRAHEGATRKKLAEHLAPVDETILAADLHWLIHDGYVVEFHDGRLWALDDRPPKPVTPIPAAETTVTSEPVPVAPNPSEPAPILETPTAVAVQEPAPAADNPAN